MAFGANGFDNRPNNLLDAALSPFSIISSPNNLLDTALSPFSGIISSRPNAKFMSGARCALKVNGELVGFAFGISWSITTSFSEINTLDNYLPEELAPQRITVEGTLSALHVPGVSCTTLGWQGDVNSLLFAPYISIEARDQGTNQLIFATDKAVIINRTEDLRVDQLSNVAIRWRAIGFIDEKKPQINIGSYNLKSDGKIAT